MKIGPVENGRNATQRILRSLLGGERDITVFCLFHEHPSQTVCHFLNFHMSHAKQKCAFWAYADSEGPDQTVRMHSLTWAFAVQCQNHLIL